MQHTTARHANNHVPQGTNNISQFAIITSINHCNVIIRLWRGVPPRLRLLVDSTSKRRLMRWAWSQREARRQVNWPCHGRHTWRHTSRSRESAKRPPHPFSRREVSSSAVHTPSAPVSGLRPPPLYKGLAGSHCSPGETPPAPTATPHHPPSPSSHAHSHLNSPPSHDPPLPRRGSAIFPQTHKHTRRSMHHRHQAGDTRFVL
jgi:hypothetical protein